MLIDRIWELCTKKFHHEISKKELEELESLLRENQDAFQINELFSGLGELPFKPVADEAVRSRSFDAIREAIGINDKQAAILINSGTEAERRSGKGRIRNLLLSVLGSVIGVTGIVWFTTKNTDNLRRNAANMNEIKTDPGSKTTVHLPDGSAAVLNAGSQLSYNKEFGISSREIRLKGEAYFDIRKNPEMPLVVHAGIVDIWVKGTTFNVKAYPEDSTIEADLLTGVIELVSQKDPERKILLRPYEKIIIGNTFSNRPPAGIVKPASSDIGSVSLTRMKPDPVDSSYAETAWLQNKLVFRSEPFRGLARAMERRYMVNIEFRDSVVDRLVFTGSFSNETIRDAMEALKKTVPFHYTIYNKTVFISK